jgi:hypothetical protein
MSEQVCVCHGSVQVAGVRKRFPFAPSRDCDENVLAVRGLALPPPPVLSISDWAANKGQALKIKSRQTR